MTNVTRTFYKWLIAIPCFGLSTLFLGVIIIALAFIGYGDLGSRTLAVAWARFNSRILGMTVSIEGLKHLRPNQSYVITANHISALDILLIYGYLPTELKWVMKKELRRVPIIGAACQAMGHIIIDRSNSTRAVESIQHAAHKLVNGMCILFFPEGTRTKPGRVVPFKKGAFRLAIDLTLPVLPMTIDGTERLLPSETLDWRPGAVTLRIHPEISTLGLSSNQVDILCSQVEAVTRGTPVPSVAIPARKIEA
jgi:1-acyl-sn-glycerol-3-phosphate acyltransferase